MFEPNMTMADKALSKLQSMREFTLEDVYELDNVKSRDYVAGELFCCTFQDDSKFTVLDLILTFDNFKYSEV